MNSIFLNLSFIEDPALPEEIKGVLESPQGVCIDVENTGLVFGILVTL